MRATSTGALFFLGSAALSAACGGVSSGGAAGDGAVGPGSQDASRGAPAVDASSKDAAAGPTPDAAFAGGGDAAAGCAAGQAEAGAQCCPVYPGERTVWCETFDQLDTTFWEAAPGYDSSYVVMNGMLVLQRSTSGTTGIKSHDPWGYGIYRYRFRVESGNLEPQTGWAIWQWQNTGSAPTGTFNEVDAIEIYGDGWDPSLPPGGSTGSAYLNNLWIQCPMVSNPPASCVRGQDVYPTAPINDGQWHDLEVHYMASQYELLIDGASLRTIGDANLPLPPMAIYFAVNYHSGTHPLTVDIDQCSYAVELSD